VVGAWQRAIAQAGLTAGQFYTIYNEKASSPIEDKALRERFRAKRDTDLAKIIERMDEVELQRNYRIVSVLETVANELEHDVLPKLRTAKAKWRRGVLIGDGIALGALVAAAIGAAVYFKWVPSLEMFTFAWIKANWIDTTVGVVAVAILAFAFHFWMRGFVAKRIAKRLSESYGQVELNLKNAFLKSAGAFRSIFRVEPAGWSKRAGKHLRTVRETVATHIQNLNDRYADPSGKTAIPKDDPAKAEKTT